MIVLPALATLMGAGEVCAQAPATEAQAPSPVVVAPAGKIQTEERQQQHRFSDKKNDWLFAGVGAAPTVNYFFTYQLMQRVRAEGAPAQPLRGYETHLARDG